MLFRENECVYGQLEILGPQLSTAYVNFREESVHDEEIAEAWNSCVNLKQLEILAPTLNGVLDLFAVPKPLLEDLTLIFAHTDDEPACDVKEVMDCISRRCSSLEKLVVHAVKPLAVYFKSIVYKNRALRWFSVEFLYDEADDNGDETRAPVYNVRELMGVFLKSPTLEKLEFTSSFSSFVEPYDDISKKVLERGVQISFDNVDLLGSTEKWADLLAYDDDASLTIGGGEAEEEQEQDGWPMDEHQLLDQLNQQGIDVDEMI